MSLGLASTQLLFQSAKMESTSMQSIKVAVLETLGEFLVDVKLLLISCQVQELTIFKPFKTSLQKAGTAYQAHKTAWQEVSVLLKDQMYFWTSKHRAREITEFQVSLAIIVQRKHGKTKDGIRKIMESQSKKIRLNKKVPKNDSDLP